VRNSFRILSLALLSSLYGCSSLTFLAVNTPAAFGHYSKHTDVSYADQARNKLDVYAPETLKAPMPVVIFVHGGGWNNGDKAQYKFVGAAFAEQGYVAVLPNYRLYPEIKSPAFYEDIAAVVFFVRAHVSEWGGDPERIYLVGHSAGAQIAMMIALNDQYLHEFGGSSEWIRGVVGLAGPYDFLPFTRPYMNDLFGPPDHFAASQPINYVRANAPPLLLMHGLQDHTVAPTNTRHLYDAMTSIGGKVQVQYFETATHSDLIAAFSFIRNRKPPVIALINQFVATENASRPGSSQAGAR